MNFSKRNLILLAVCHRVGIDDWTKVQYVQYDTNIFHKKEVWDFVKTGISEYNPNYNLYLYDYV